MLGMHEVKQYPPVLTPLERPSENDKLEGATRLSVYKCRFSRANPCNFNYITDCYAFLSKC